MKILIVAHPDDEVLWFNPEDYDKIYIVFCARDDKPGMGLQRFRAIKEHPLNVECFYLKESGYHKDKRLKKEYELSRDELITKLKELKDITKVTTHDAQGEYGHLDHRLVHDTCMEVFDCKVNGKNPKMYRKIKKLYQKNLCWTWD